MLKHLKSSISLTDNFVKESSTGNKIVIAEHLEDNLNSYKVKAKRFLCMVKKTTQG